MNLNTIKNKLNDIQQKSTGAKKEKVDYSKIYWKPKVGKFQIRFVPSKLDKETPFKEIFVHYGFGKFPMFALTNWGEKDPIVEFAAKLRSTSEKENWSLARKIDPKMRIVAPIIVRGEEHLGVRLWEFGKEIYTDLLGYASDEEYGDFTDIAQGFDFSVEGVEADIQGRKGIKCTVRIKRKDSVLSEKPEEVSTWLEEQPDILAVQRKYTFDELKNILQNYLTPESESQSEQHLADAEVEDEGEDEEDNTSTVEKTTISKETVASKKSADKFDAIFDNK